ncbi:MAG: ferrous iron transport protein A [Leptonema sp. (in: bacteria)]
MQQTKIKFTKCIQTLDKIPLNVNAIIKNVKTDSHFMIRLMELGIVPGETITVLRSAPFGDPIEISIIGYSLCIRKKEASQIEVEYEGNC